MRRVLLLTVMMLLFVVCTSPAATPTAFAAPPAQIVSPTPTSSPVFTPTSTPSPTPSVTPIPPPTSRSQTGAADEWLGKADEREKLYNTYAQTIKGAQAFSELEFKRLGTTWEKELERAKKRFLEADTKTDVYYALLSLQRTIHDMHSSLTVPSGLMPPSQTLLLPFMLGVRGNSLESARYIVVQSALPELKPGYVLKQYNNQTPAQLEYATSEWLSSASPENLKLELANALTRYTNSNRYPPPDINTPVSVVCVDPASQREIGVTVQWQTGAADVPSQDYANLSVDYTGINYRLYKDATNQLIILVYSSFNYSLRDADLKGALARVSYKVPPFDNAQPLESQTDWTLKFFQANEHPDTQGIKNYSFWRLLEEVEALNLGRYLNQQTYPNLLVDVRNNSGGSIPINLTALLARERFKTPTLEVVYTPLMKNDSAFLQEALTFIRTQSKFILDQLARERDAVKSARFPFNCKTLNCSISETDYDPNQSIKKFNVAVLTGPGCISSCDHFVSMVKDNNLGLIVGLPPRGADSPTRSKKEFTLKNGDLFSIVFTTAIGYRVNGEPQEGNPAQVNYYLFPEDDYLAKMIAYLKANGAFK